MKYSTFKELFKNHKWVNKWYKSVPIWICSNIVMFIALCFLRSIITQSKESHKYPSDKYRKVVKEGLFWDSIEYHER